MKQKRHLGDKVPLWAPANAKCHVSALKPTVCTQTHTYQSGVTEEQQGKQADRGLTWKQHLSAKMDPDTRICSGNDQIKITEIHPGVVEEVCWRLIKDSDLCSLHQKEADIMFPEEWNMGAAGCDVHFIQRGKQIRRG